MGFYWWHEFPKPALRPKPVAGKRNKKFGLTWWGKKWVNAVESIGDSQRMSRGRAYARAERVFNIRMNCGQITAKVEGSLGNYNVMVKFDTINGKKWGGIIGKIRASHALGAILNNQLPEDLKKICGVDIVPPEFTADCSCPDYANPCKHIAALYYVLAEEIDLAPQILFKLRGLERDALFAMLSGSPPAAVKGKPRKQSLGKKRASKKGMKKPVTKPKSRAPKKKRNRG